MKVFLLGALKLYQWIFRPLLGPRCRFFPSCSDYAREAIAVHGAATGSLLTAQRLCKCHPFNEGGLNPVPPAPLRSLWIRND
jgi:uncharacterized protein